MDWSLQLSLTPNDCNIVCGLDEAGRGPLAGPVFAAAVILPEGCVIEGLNDSKKLSEKRRNALCREIKDKAIDWAIAHAEPYEIDKINILNASMLAMKRAVLLLKVRPELLLVDGNVARDLPLPSLAVVKGDGKLPSVAAASILAKVARDEFCLDMDGLYPQYQFAKNKGYPTKDHRDLLKKYGPCPAHRQSFLRKILGEVNDSFQESIWS
ncbi:MAG: ribonuclease HII [Ruminococcaceae bacterium]|nr:ribonuclease HII [Oscillospiraceae bacterium]